MRVMLRCLPTFDVSATSSSKEEESLGGLPRRLRATAAVATVLSSTSKVAHFVLVGNDFRPLQLVLEESNQGRPAQIQLQRACVGSRKEESPHRLG